LVVNIAKKGTREMTTIQKILILIGLLAYVVAMYQLLKHKIEGGAYLLLIITLVFVALI